MNSWNDADAQAVYQRQRIGGALGFGQHPAVLVVDFVNGFADAGVLGGGNIAPAILATQQLLASARAARVPVYFTRIVYTPEQAAASVFCRKMPSLATLYEDNPQSAVVPELPVWPGEEMVRKTGPSAFFGTDLASSLAARGVDSVLVAGCTTSGCVRATVVDAMSCNLQPIVVEDCVGDRALGPHNASLFDMAQKYADVQRLDAVCRYLQSLPSSRGSAHAR